MVLGEPGYNLLLGAVFLLLLTRRERLCHADFIGAQLLIMHLMVNG